MKQRLCLLTYSAFVHAENVVRRTNSGTKLGFRDSLRSRIWPLEPLPHPQELLQP